MREKPSPILEHKRFNISPASLEILKEMKASLPEVQKKYPQIVGLCFAGSRTLGTESGNSDLDLAIFTDSRKWDTSQHAQRLTSAGLREVLPKRVKLDLEDKVMPRLRQIDIAPASLDLLLKDFLNDIAFRQRLQRDKLPVREWTFGPESYRLRSLFALSVGEQVYTARQYVLNRLKEFEDGDSYLRLIMVGLEGLERSSRKRPYPRYKGLPTTIEEAERYFVTDAKHVEPLRNQEFPIKKRTEP